MGPSVSNDATLASTYLNIASIIALLLGMFLSPVRFHLFRQFLVGIYTTIYFGTLYIYCKRRCGPTSPALMIYNIIHSEQQDIAQSRGDLSNHRSIPLELGASSRAIGLG